MSDLELLELAAKAAGFEFADKLIPEAQGKRKGPFILKSRWTQWNPITDDGDALRLAVKLGIEVLPDREINEACTEFCVHRPDLIFLGTREKFSNDEMAATRRAIVRAAAEIGRQMQEGGAA